jgi:hypothetical protein
MRTILSTAYVSIPEGGTLFLSLLPTAILSGPEGVVLYLEAVASRFVEARHAMRGQLDPPYGNRRCVRSLR